MLLKKAAPTGELRVPADGWACARLGSAEAKSACPSTLMATGDNEIVSGGHRSKESNFRMRWLAVSTTKGLLPTKNTAWGGKVVPEEFMAPRVPALTAGGVGFC